MGHFTMTITGKTKDGTDDAKLAASLVERLRADGHEVSDATVTNIGSDTPASIAARKGDDAKPKPK